MEKRTVVGLVPLLGALVLAPGLAGAEGGARESAFARLRSLAPHQAIAEHGLEDEDGFADYGRTANYRHVEQDGTVETRIEGTTTFRIVKGKLVNPVHDVADEDPPERGPAFPEHRGLARMLLRGALKAKTWTFPQTRDASALEATAEHRGDFVTVWTTSEARFDRQHKASPPAKASGKARR